MEIKKPVINTLMDQSKKIKVETLIKSKSQDIFDELIEVNGIYILI
jgi:hypothetical protein